MPQIVECLTHNSQHCIVYLPTVQATILFGCDSAPLRWKFCMWYSRAVGEGKFWLHKWHMVFQAEFQLSPGVGEGLLLLFGDVEEFDFMLKSSSPDDVMFPLVSLFLQESAFNSCSETLVLGEVRWSAFKGRGMCAMPLARLWITDISFILWGGTPFINGGNWYWKKSGARGGNPVCIKGFSLCVIINGGSMDIRRPRRDGLLFHIWVPIWTFRFPFVVKAFPQTVHLKGLSPVCVLIWICRALALLKPFWQTWHWCFSGVLRRNGEESWDPFDMLPPLFEGLLPGVLTTGAVLTCLSWPLVSGTLGDASEGDWSSIFFSSVAESLELSSFSGFSLLLLLLLKELGRSRILCVSMCCFMFPLVVNDRSHTSHL